MKSGSGKGYRVQDVTAELQAIFFRSRWNPVMERYSFRTGVKQFLRLSFYETRVGVIVQGCIFKSTIGSFLTTLHFYGFAKALFTAQWRLRELLRTGRVK